MYISPWITGTIAIVVILFGLYRLYLAATLDAQARDAQAAPPRGLRSLPRRTHLLVGIVYLLLGGLLLAGLAGISLF